MPIAASNRLSTDAEGATREKNSGIDVRAQSWDGGPVFVMYYNRRSSFT